MGAMKTPGVYIVEKNAFGNSVVEVATAVPAFIGHTEKAVNGGKSLASKPWRISSISEYHNFFGGAPDPRFDISEKPEDSFEESAFSLDGKEYLIKQSAGKYLLYYSMLLFFQNGGGPCYIVSVGNYKDDIEGKRFTHGIELLVKEQEPTMVLMPEVILLDEDNCISVQQATLAHCGNKMRSRIALLDIWDGYRDRQDPQGDCIASFRSKLGINFLDFSSAYYPWVNTTIVQDSDLNYQSINNIDLLQSLIKTELNLPDQPPEVTVDMAPGDKLKTVQVGQILETVNNLSNDFADLNDNDKAANIHLIDKAIRSISSIYNQVLSDTKSQLNLLPPAAAMAGVYTMVDNTKGVWKAPANVSLAAVVSPCVNITDDEQEDLNVTTTGKSINAIRSFMGEGTLVWGARTLDGNSLDWRYVNVRRTMIMLEQSIKLAAKAYVFDNNVAKTWVTVKSLIQNFLTGIWKRGGLAGSSPDDAFSVSVGLGETMTPQDILEGVLRVTVLVALIRPAEFIEITFQQQMQKS